MTSAFLVGQWVYLRPLEDTGLPQVQKRTNDPEIRRLSGEVRPVSGSAALEFQNRDRRCD
jgi:hypothetical protein